MKRSIPLCIVFSIITCGIYGIYWMVKMNDELNSLAGVQGTSGVTVVLLTLVTCGIYGWYWSYKMGQNVDVIKGSQNTGVIYIVLALFGLSIVNYCLMQDTINNAQQA